MLLGGVYKKKDERYHYNSVLRGTFRGTNDSINCEL